MGKITRPREIERAGEIRKTGETGRIAKISRTGRKVFSTVAAVLMIAIALDGTAHASAGNRSDMIKSQGSIHYDNGRVVIDSADLRVLAQEADRLEKTYKTGIRDTLAQIGTYIQQDGSVSYDNNADVDARQIAFGSLVRGILQSQSVAYLADVQASDTGGPIYYKNENNHLLEVTGSDTGMPVFIVPATEDNLTLQTAAWVDGRCLVGNGSDNRYFYRKGFIEGYAEHVGAAIEYHYDDAGRIEYAELIYP